MATLSSGDITGFKAVVSVCHGLLNCFVVVSILMAYIEYLRRLKQ